MNWRNGTMKLMMPAAAGLVVAVVMALLPEHRSLAAPAPMETQGTRAPGTQRRWGLVFDVHLEQPGSKEPISIQLTGDWVRTVAAVRAGEYDVALEMQDLRVTGGGAPGGSADEVEALRRRLARRFWGTYRTDGALLRVHFPKDVDPGDRNLLQMIATEAQLVRAAGNEPHWTAVERDGAGMYLASYQRAGERVVKRKLKYLEADGTAGAAPSSALRIDIGESEQRFTLDGEGELATAEGGGRLGLDVGMGAGQMLTVRTSTRLSQPRDAVAPELAGSLERARAEVQTSPVRSHAPDPEQVQAQQDRTLLEGWSTETLLAAARAPERDPSLPRRLSALFRRRPEAIAAVSPLVREGNKVAVEALAMAGTAPALEVLGRSAHDGGAATQTRVDALAALVFIQRPTVEVMRLPSDLLDDANIAIRRAARLMSGALARAGRAEHATEAATIDDELVARLAKTTDVSEQVELLAALGNSAGKATVDASRAALANERADVRAAAVEALRLSEDPAVDGLLADTITGDRDPGVRAAAIFAAGFRRAGSFLDAVQRAALADTAEQVRSGAVSLLRKHLNEAPAIAKTLARVAEQDPSQDIRRLAREALDVLARGTDR